MNLQTTAQISIRAPIERVFDASIDCQNLPQFFTGYKAIPAIVSATTSDGLALHEGSTRIVHNSDRSTIQEVIVTLQRPHLQEYRLVSGFKPPFSWLVRSASGRWVYDMTEGNTTVQWIFVFETRNILADWIFRLAVAKPFQIAQTICLENIRRSLER